MIYKNLEFYNVDELEVVDGISGVRLQRFPRGTREKLGHRDHERGRFYSQRSVGCEIRFVTDARFIRVSLSALEEDGTVFVYKGNFLHSVQSIKAGVITTLHLEEPEKFKNVSSKALDGYSFSSKVWRLLFGKDCCMIFHHIDTFGHEVRPPQKNETPSIKWLAYGSSITFGGNTTIYSNSYIHQAARRLKVDVLNKGIAGSCFCDKEVADYIAQNNEWDFVTLELGVNMRGRFSHEEFEKRVGYLINTILRKRPNKVIIVIGIYANGSEYSLDKESKIARDTVRFNEILKEIVLEINSNKLYFIDGKEILTDFSGLSTDLLHPSDDGHILMGENLSHKLKSLLDTGLIF